MSDYLSITEKEKQEMLEKIGVQSTEEFYQDIPVRMRAKKLNLPEGKSTQETCEFMEGLSKLNKVYDTVFLGAGCYKHYIPPVVKAIIGREEFVTAYTPYQAEMSQGILQSIFEYQTMICNLTKMDVSNASHYSGATAAAEACLMCTDKAKTVLTFDNINPDTLEVLKTYLAPRGVKLIICKTKDGRANINALKKVEGVGCVFLQTPNFYGLIENAKNISKAVHEYGAKLVVSVNPISLGLLEAPGDYDADIAVGEAQPLGMDMNFGGPYLGFIAAKKDLVRKMPGRIVGETVDHDGNRAYVLTLQAREQHIRREKASSNICSNQALCALTASVYLATVGAEGLKEVATACASYAHYMATALEFVGAKIKYPTEFFHEFVTVTPGKAKRIIQALDNAGILGGWILNDDEILWCCTEVLTKEEIDNAVNIVGGVL